MIFSYRLIPGIGVINLKNIVIKIITGTMAVFMLASSAACGKTPTTSNSKNSSGAESVISTEANSGSDASATDEVSGVSETGASASVLSSNSTAGSAVNSSGSKASSQVPMNFDSIKGTTVKIHVGANPSDKDKKIAAEFEAKYGCKVSYVLISWSEFQTKFVQSVNSKNPVDYITVSDQEFVNYAAKNLIQPIDSYINLNDSRFSQKFMGMFQWKGKHYVMYNPANYTSSYGFIFFNKTMFEDEGITDPYTLYKQGKWNFQQFRETARLMTKDTNKDGKMEIRGFGTWWYDAFILMNGNSQVKINSNATIDITLNQKNAYTAMQLIEDMQLVDHSYDWNTNATDQFMNSRLAMIFERPWHAVGNYDLYNEENFPDEIGICPPPKGTDAGSTYYAPTIIHGNGIPVGAKNPKAAVAWYLFNCDYAASHKNDASSVAERRRSLSDEHLKIANDFIAKATPINSHANGIGGWYFSKWDMWAGILRDNVPPATTVAKNINILKNEIAQTIGKSTSGNIDD